MKNLLLMRHAEPNINILGVKDINRSLNEIGTNDAEMMGKHMKIKKYIPDIIISSPAVRALSTAKIIAKIINYPFSKIIINRNIYYSSSKEILEIIQNVSNKYDILMITGHNPTLHHLSQTLTGEQVFTFPTCSIFCIQFDVEHWNQIDVGEKKFMIFPDYNL